MKISIIKFIDYYLGIPLCFIIGLLFRIKERIRPIDYNRPIRKILLIKTWGLGNIVLMLPSIKAIREALPDAKLSFLSLAVNRDILESNPLIDSYYLLDLSNTVSFLKSSFWLILSLRKQRFDVVLDFDQFARFSALIRLFIGVPRRIGFDTPTQGKKWASNLPVVYNNNQHVAGAFADLLKKIGIKDIDLSPVAINITSDDRKKVDEFLQDNHINQRSPLLGMHLGSGDNFPQRRWPIENFIELANRLIRQYNVTVILTGNGKEEEGLNKLFCSMLRSNVLNTCSRFNVREIAYLIKKCRLFFSSDTAPLHIASAMGVAVVGFFGPNTPLLYGPRGNNDLLFYHHISCSPCLTNFNAKTSSCHKLVCITGITVDEVWQRGRKYFETLIIK